MDPEPTIDQLYHLILLTSATSKDPHPHHHRISRTRILGTYISLHTAQAAAHSCLFDAGYARDFFTRYETDASPEPSQKSDGQGQGQGLAVFAQAADGTTFRVYVQTTSNSLPQLQQHSAWEVLGDGRVPVYLYYVVQSTVTGDNWGVNVLALFLTYQAAREYAEWVLLSGKDRIMKESYVDYVLAVPGERASEFEGDGDVVVHATGLQGEEFWSNGNGGGGGFSKCTT
ncbi:hypothetical protein BO71DRAFT_440115 [Aspergillus ellipticus CBS 707.79]|uniref:Uncharacterized protein n=1 Tax=Aspergillus ellipticus CBS 707.79 TaxID=1448320 RepID=A0A319DE82_9EURO|nr:hypothetical protein BO71DRAFT_440115 [Aspergillus ellipticus CBS 707.79]